jgi:hypothetical protein
MNMARCVKCDVYVNTDFDPDAYVEKPNYTNTAMPVNTAFTQQIEYECVCESCREK